MSKKVISGISLVLLLTTTISYVNGTEVETVTVEPEDFAVFKLFLEKRQKFKGSLTIIAGNEIDFWIVAPTAEDYVVEFHNVNHEAEFEFVAKESGTYLCVFRNLFSSESAIIELSYDLYNPIEIKIDFFTLILISIGVVATIIIVIWWKS